jgi:predicted RNA-binding protein with RPS1 domain
MPDTAESISRLVVGARYEGVISGIQPDGVLVQFTQGTGLCDKRVYRSNINHEALSRGERVTVEVLAVRNDEKLSLALVDRLDDDGAPDPVETLTRLTSKATLNAENARHASRIAKAIKAGTSAVNDLGKQFGNNTPESRAGYVNEAVHTADFNIDAAIKKTKVRAERVAANGKCSPDIRILDGSGKVVQEVSSKVCQNAEKTAGSQRPYGNQVRLVPEDQLDDVRKIARKGAASNRAKSSPQRAKVAQEHQQVADLATDHIEKDGVRSRARTRRESQELGNKAREGKITGADLVNSSGRAALDGAMAGGKSGAMMSAGITAVGGVIKVCRTRRKGKKAIMKAAREAAADVAGALVDGGAKGALGGAATASAQVAGQGLASAGAKRVLNSSLPATVAITVFEIAKHSIGYARGKSTTDEFRTVAGKTVLNNSITFIAAEVGFAIGGPIGALVGGLAAPLLVAAGRALFGEGPTYRSNTGQIRTRGVPRPA